MAAGYQVRARANCDYEPFTSELTIGTGTPLSLDTANAHVAGIDLKGRLVQQAAGPPAGTIAADGSGPSGTVRFPGRGRASKRADADIAANPARIPGTPPITIEYNMIRGSMGKPRDAGTEVRRRCRSRCNVRRDTPSASRMRAGTLAGRARHGGPRCQRIERGPFTTRRAGAGDAGAGARQSARHGERRRLPPRSARQEVRKEGEDWRLSPYDHIAAAGAVRASRAVTGRGRWLHAARDAVDLLGAPVLLAEPEAGGKASGNLDLCGRGRGRMPDVNAKLTVTGPHAHRHRHRLHADGSRLVGRQPQWWRRGCAGGGAAGAGPVVGLNAGAWLGHLAVGTRRLPGASGSWGRRFPGAYARAGGPAERALVPERSERAECGLGRSPWRRISGGRLDRARAQRHRGTADSLRYAEQAYGTTLTNLALQGRFTQSRLELPSLTAKAGEGGAVSASGNVRVDAGVRAFRWISRPGRTARSACPVGRVQAGSVSGTLLRHQPAGTTAPIRGDRGRLPARASRASGTECWLVWSRWRGYNGFVSRTCRQGRFHVRLVVAGRGEEDAWHLKQSGMLS